LEQIKEEGKWLDSIRGLAGSRPQPETIMEEDNALLGASVESHDIEFQSQEPRRDILPRSPAQLMSPPLQSQICFTPIPASSSRVQSQNSRDRHSKSRVLSPTKPLVVLSASKSRRKVQGDTMSEDPMKKVERIMASSWSARDLGQGGMRNLSPTGFGRHL
jgi:hypothetical protein